MFARSFYLYTYIKYIYILKEKDEILFVRSHILRTFA